LTTSPGVVEVENVVGDLGSDGIGNAQCNEVVFDRTRIVTGLEQCDGELVGA
jgi:hypothetical protein